ncbi:hypothetical protein L596_003792 [Steinernema carpocapsae]|uniref:Uncharacterized protein n=1 Tax=Steinernema carpocapsae TaxID=34508 RepID=A0A4U8UTK3_STECR|nr:hypothetical protein L596_003792 [Steinernema carpocapsae]
MVILRVETEGNRVKFKHVHFYSHRRKESKSVWEIHLVVSETRRTHSGLRTGQERVSHPQKTSGLDSLSTKGLK